MGFILKTDILKQINHETCLACQAGKQRIPL